MLIRRRHDEYRYDITTSQYVKYFFGCSEQNLEQANQCKRKRIFLQTHYIFISVICVVVVIVLIVVITVVIFVLIYFCNW